MYDSTFIVIVGDKETLLFIFAIAKRSWNRKNCRENIYAAFACAAKVCQMKKDDQINLLSAAEFLLTHVYFQRFQSFLLLERNFPLKWNQFEVANLNLHVLIEYKFLANYSKVCQKLLLIVHGWILI